MRVKSTEFFPNCLKEKNGAQETPFFLGKLQKNNAIAHCGKLYKENLRLDPVSGEVWIVAGWREGMGVHHVWVLGGGRVEGWKDGRWVQQQPEAWGTCKSRGRLGLGPASAQSKACRNHI